MSFNLDQIWNGPIGQTYRDQGLFNTYEDMQKWFDSNNNSVSTMPVSTQGAQTTATTTSTQPGQIATPWTNFGQPAVEWNDSRLPQVDWTIGPGINPPPATGQPAPQPGQLLPHQPGELPEGYNIPRVDWSRIPLTQDQFNRYLETNNVALTDLWQRSGLQGHMDFKDFTALMYTRNGGANLPNPNQLTFEQLHQLIGDSPAYHTQRENRDWAAELPGYLNDLIGEVLMNGDPNAVDLTSLWFADIIANTPNISRAYNENMNQFIEGTNKRIENTEAFFGAMMGQYGQAAAEAAAAYQKLQGQGDAQIGALSNLIAQIGPEFAASLARQQVDYRELQAALAQLSQRSDIDYRDFIEKFENALAKQEGEYQQFKGQGEDIYRHILEQYGNTRGTANEITQEILDAYRRVVSGEVSDASRGFIDEIFQHNQDLINQNFDETMEKERRQLVDQMAGRGILTSGVTGRAYNDMTEAALREKQRSLSEIGAQRAATLLEMPFKQAEAANQLNQHIDTLTNLTSSEANDLINILQTQYGMSRDNAMLALQNITQQANLWKDKALLDQNNFTNMTNLFRDNYNLEQQNLTNKFGQMNTAHQTQANILNAMMGHDSAYHATAANRLASQGAFGNQNLALQHQMAESIPNQLGQMFDRYGNLSRDFLHLMLERELGHRKIDASVGNQPGTSNPLPGLIGGAIGGGDVCVRKGTTITMADGSKKKAQDVKSGDRVKSFDVQTNAYTTTEVVNVRNSEFRNFYEIKLLNGKTLEVSSYHPILTYTGRRYKFGVIGYWHAVKNVIKHTFFNPAKIVDSIKYAILAIKRYGKLKKMQRVVCDNFENSPILSITKKTGKDAFFNFKTSENEYPTFIANDMVIEALYKETEKFTNWIAEDGESFDRR